MRGKRLIGLETTRAELLHLGVALDIFIDDREIAFARLVLRGSRSFREILLDGAISILQIFAFELRPAEFVALRLQLIERALPDGLALRLILIGDGLIGRLVAEIRRVVTLQENLFFRVIGFLSGGALCALQVLESDIFEAEATQRRPLGV